MAFSIFNKPIALDRYAPGAYIDGVWVKGAVTSLVLQTSVQPTKPSDLQRLPEGRRLEVSFTLYSKQLIQESDEVVLYGARYEVLHVATWQNGILPHYMAIAVKMQEERVT